MTEKFGRRHVVALLAYLGLPFETKEIEIIDANFEEVNRRKIERMVRAGGGTPQNYASALVETAHELYAIVIPKQMYPGISGTFCDTRDAEFTRKKDRRAITAQILRDIGSDNSKYLEALREYARERRANPQPSA